MVPVSGYGLSIATTSGPMISCSTKRVRGGLDADNGRIQSFSREAMRSTAGGAGVRPPDGSTSATAPDPLDFRSSRGTGTPKIPRRGRAQAIALLQSIVYEPFLNSTLSQSRYMK